MRSNGKSADDPAIVLRNGSQRIMEVPPRDDDQNIAAEWASRVGSDTSSRLSRSIERGKFNGMKNITFKILYCEISIVSKIDSLLRTWGRVAAGSTFFYFTYKVRANSQRPIQHQCIIMY